MDSITEFDFSRGPAGPPQAQATGQIPTETIGDDRGEQQVEPGQ
jgi:hypothetical protein